jgi:N4-gp56 family major capsid protein
MANQNFAGLSQRTTNHAYANHLVHAEPALLASTFGKKYPIPANKADTIKMRRVVPASISTSTMTEGVPPTIQALAYEDVTATLGQYGGGFGITDKIADLAEDPVMKDATAMCGEQHGGVIEQVTLGVIRGGTNVAYANKVGGRSSVVAAVSLNDLRGATMYLRSKKAKTIGKYVPSVNKAVAEPVRPAYIGLCHSNAEADLEQITGWTPIEKYGDAMGQLPYEIGKIGSIRFCASPDMPVWADAGGAKGSMRSTSGTSADVYPIIIFGEDAYGSTSVQGKKDVDLVVRNVGTPDSVDFLGQTGSVGWKSWFAALILNQNWIIRLETAVTNY